MGPVLSVLLLIVAVTVTVIIVTPIVVHYKKTCNRVAPEAIKDTKTVIYVTSNNVSGDVLSFVFNSYILSLECIYTYINDASHLLSGLFGPNLHGSIPNK